MSDVENKDFSPVPEGLAKTREEFIQKIRQPEEENKPVVHSRCGDCLAFKTHFCPFWLCGNGEISIQAADHACSDWILRPETRRRGRFNWAEVVTNL